MIPWARLSLQRLSFVDTTCDFASPRARLHVVGMFGFMSDIKQPSLPTPFYSSVLVSISALMSLSTAFYSANSPDNSSFSDSVLPVLFLPYWSFHLYFTKVSFSPDIIPSR